jgi:hypothetical protein
MYLVTLELKSAGVAGYAWVAILHNWLGLSFSSTLLLANLLVGLWLATYLCLLPPVGSVRAMSVAYSSVPGKEDTGRASRAKGR